MEKTITVTISPQIFDIKRYYGNPRCYLEQALDNMGIEGSMVFGFGETRINKYIYTPRDLFCCDTLARNFEKGVDTEVVLVRK